LISAERGQITEHLPTEPIDKNSARRCTAQHWTTQAAFAGYTRQFTPSFFYDPTKFGDNTQQSSFLDKILLHVLYHFTKWNQA